MNAFTVTTFAGFNLPRTEGGPTIYNPTAKPSMAREYLAQRLTDWLKHGKTRGCIGRVTYPNRIRTAETARDFNGWGFYLPMDGSDAMGLRWAWCDEAPDDWDHENSAPRLDHSGWFLDDYQGDKARGIVCKLPRGRGFMAGYSLGEGMCSELDNAIYTDIGSAVYAADSMAENAAEAEREYREEHDESEEA